MFDNTCKFPAESFSEDFASWLLGEPITMTRLSPSIRAALPLAILSLEPIRADTLILLNAVPIYEFQILLIPTICVL